MMNYPHRPVSEYPSAARPARRGVLPAPGQPAAPPVRGAACLPRRGPASSRGRRPVRLHPRLAAVGGAGLPRRDPGLLHRRQARASPPPDGTWGRPLRSIRKCGPIELHLHELPLNQIASSYSGKALGNREYAAACPRSRGFLAWVCSRFALFWWGVVAAPMSRKSGETWGTPVSGTPFHPDRLPGRMWDGVRRLSSGDGAVFDGT